MQRMESTVKPVTLPSSTLAKEPLSPISMNKNESILPTSANQAGTPTPTNAKSGWGWMSFSSSPSTKATPTAKTAVSTSDSYHCAFDLTYMTSRLMVMTTPNELSPDETFPSTAELTRQLLDEQYSNQYMLYSLDDTADNRPTYRKEFFHNKTLDLPLFKEKQVPSLVIVLLFCRKITAHLLESPSNVAVLHCHDDKNQLAFGTCLLLAYHGLSPEVEQIIQFYTHHRGGQPTLTNSQKRYIQYLCELSNGIIERPCFTSANLKSISLSPVPLVNRSKTSCRPFVEIYDDNHQRIFSSYEEINKLRVYKASDPACIFPVNLPFNGDLTIHITHAPINTARRTHEGGVRICELTINPNFRTTQCPELSFSRNELDGIDQTDKKPTLFRLTLEISQEQKPSTDQPDTFIEQLEDTLKKPLALFRDDNELKQRVTDAGKSVKQTNGEEGPVSPPAVVHRAKKPNEPTTPASTTSTSSRNSHRFSGSLSPAPQSPSSTAVINPFHPSARKSTPRTSQVFESTVPDAKSNSNMSAVSDLVDIGESVRPTSSSFERSMSSDASKSDLLSSIESECDSVNVYASSKATLQRQTSQSFSLPTPLVAQPVSHSKEHASTPAPTPPQASAGPNYNVTVPTNPPPSVRPPYVRQNSQYLATPKFNNDLFDDLSPFDHAHPPVAPPPATTIGGIQKAALAKTLDPNVLKIREWTEGRKGNIRALLCSLLQVTWPGCKWAGCQMNDLVDMEQVKKAYRRAVLFIHPDKLTNDPNQELAKLIFMELNEGWANFEEQSRRSAASNT